MSTFMFKASVQLAKSCFATRNVDMASPKKPTYNEEELAAFSTIDGSVVAYNAGTNAVSCGSGIFIGDYFVGIDDNFESIRTTPFVRY